jgi:hypothetical protein
MKNYSWELMVLFFMFTLSMQVGSANSVDNNSQSDQIATNQQTLFKPDGVISEGEFENQVKYRDLEIFWKSDGKYIYMSLRGKTQGYISIGIQPGSMMKDADIILAYVEKDQIEILDQYSTGDFGPHPSDEELGGTNDILEYGGMELDGFTTIEFKRLLKTEDKYDLELKQGKNKIIWAYSNRDHPQAGHSTRGYGEIEIHPSENSM